MKPICYAATTALLSVALTSCFPEPETLSEENTDTESTITRAFIFHLKGAFETSYEDMTRTVRLESDNTAGMTDVWVLDYYDDDDNASTSSVLTQQLHQTTADESFGQPQMQLQYGHHDIVLVASKGTSPSLTGATDGSTTATLSWGKVMDTFALLYPVDVTSTSNGNRAPELQRIISGVTVQMTDEIPTVAATVDVVWQKSASITLPSLQIATPADGTQTLSFPSSYIGKTDKEFSVYTLISDADASADLTLTFRKSDQSVISTINIPSVSLRRNRMTHLAGKCFSTSASGIFSLSVSNTWSDALNLDF